MKTRYTIPAIVMLVVSGCATKGPIEYGLKDNGPLAQTAVIRPATREEKTEPKANLAIRIFVNPMGGGSVARLEYINNVSGRPGGKSLKDYSSVRVAPGVYDVGASCMVGGFIGYFSERVDAKPGKLYLLECFGNTAHTMKMKVFEHDQAPHSST